jgi:hypothetical protein
VAVERRRRSVAADGARDGDESIDGVGSGEQVGCGA